MTDNNNMNGDEMENESSSQTNDLRSELVGDSSAPKEGKKKKPFLSGLLGKSKGEQEDEAISKVEYKLLKDILTGNLKMERMKVKLNFVFKLLFLGYLVTLMLLTFKPAIFASAVEDGDAKHVAVVAVDGLISASSDANADDIITSLRAAAESEGSLGVIVSINSGGGSPVQSDYVYKEIMRLRSEFPEKKFYSVIQDIGASGAYYIASSTEEIYANENSLVGSIGVTSGGFGFDNLIDKMGVDRRVYTSGQNKNFLDPFSPENPEHIKHWKSVLKSTHQVFIDRVVEGRAGKLSKEADLFNGLIWDAGRAMEYGLIDGYHSVDSLAREVYNTDEIIFYSAPSSPFENLFKGVKSGVSSGVKEALISVMDTNSEIR